MHQAQRDWPAPQPHGAGAERQARVRAAGLDRPGAEPLEPQCAATEGEAIAVGAAVARLRWGAAQQAADLGGGVERPRAEVVRIGRRSAQAELRREDLLEAHE